MNNNEVNLAKIHLRVKVAAKEWRDLSQEVAEMQYNSIIEMMQE